LAFALCLGGKRKAVQRKKDFAPRRQARKDFFFIATSFVKLNPNFGVVATLTEGSYNASRSRHNRALRFLMRNSYERSYE
jgi:hypothetical protein